MVIKASGVDFDAMTPETVVVCDLFGELVEGELAPSSDAATHGYVYRHMPEIGGVAHTHSAYATAFAARGEAVPCVLTAIADEFGGEIPIGPFARIGDEEIGRGIVETLTGHRSPAVLMRSHGVFTLGATPRDAIKAAVMCEDAARTVHLARALGEPLLSSPTTSTRSTTGTRTSTANAERVEQSAHGPGSRRTGSSRAASSERHPT